MIKNFKWLLLVSLTFVACNNDDEVIDSNSSDGMPLTAGSADFSKYVALGDSFAAGFSDNALFIAGQNGAYPNILAQQFAQVGGGTFTTPLMSDNVGGFSGSGTYMPRLYLAPPTTPGGSPAPSSVASPPYSQSSTTNQATVLTGYFNNMGIPGAKSFHLDYPGYGSSMGNPYFARFASNPMATIVDDAVAQNPTFFSLWIGGNDVLGYATSGGTNDADITPTAVFNSAYNGLITKLTVNGRKGVVANLPYVSTLPIFTAVPTNPIPALTAAQSGPLNQLFGAINQIAAAANQPARFVTITTDDNNPATIESSNPLLIVDETLVDLSVYIKNALSPLYGVPTATYLGNLYGQTRHAKNETSDRDYILLTARSYISPPNNIETSSPSPFNVRGVSFPLPDNLVLTIDEASKIKVATDSYNTTITNAATNSNLALFDAKETMRQLSSTGINANGYTLTSTYVTGGAFSLDGVHPSPRGYALIANKFIEAINAKYGSNLKGVSLYDYRIMFPPIL
jgi:hypothetical protein